MLDEAALDTIFRTARSVHSFNSRPLTDATVHELYELLKLGPTSFNGQPGRYVFVRSPEARARLVPAMSSGNRTKVESAPVTVIVAYDMRFFEHLPDTSSAVAAMSKDPTVAQTTALRNSSLQGAYLILAARALGLAAGPMSGFDAQQVEREFLGDSSWRVNFLINLGYSDGTPVRPRQPRFPFENVARIV
jgi:3-hydroxypropanoate dehydrogenase